MSLNILMKHKLEKSHGVCNKNKYVEAPNKGSLNHSVTNKVSQFEIYIYLYIYI